MTFIDVNVPYSIQYFFSTMNLPIKLIVNYGFMQVFWRGSATGNYRQVNYQTSSRFLAKNYLSQVQWVVCTQADGLHGSLSWFVTSEVKWYG